MQLLPNQWNIDLGHKHSLQDLMNLGIVRHDLKSWTSSLEVATTVQWSLTSTAADQMCQETDSVLEHNIISHRASKRITSDQPLLQEEVEDSVWMIILVKLL